MLARTRGKRALIFCAGLGTRLGELIKDTPKPMIDINGKPCLEWIVDHLNKYGITDIIVNLHHRPMKIVKHFGSRLLYFYEPELLGEAETEERLREWLKPHYFCMNGDTLTNVDLNELSKPLVNQRFIDKGVYAGTKFVNTNSSNNYDYPIRAHWQDIGTPEGLAKARKEWPKT